MIKETGSNIVRGKAVMPEEVIRAILGDQGRSQRSLALELGVSPQALAARLSGGSNMRIGTFVEMTDALGYEVVVIPKGEASESMRLTSASAIGE